MGGVEGDTPPGVYFVHTPVSADPGYLGVATNWDGQWYRFIATDGYLPHHVDASWEAGWAWAFPPVYPKLVSLVMRIAGWEYPVSAVLLSLILGAVAVVLIYRLAEPRVGALGASGLVTMVCVFPSAPLFQVAYAESAALLLVAWSMLHLSHRQYWWASLPLVILSFTRLITPALGFVIVFHLWIRHTTGQERLSMTEKVAAAVYLTISLAGIATWSLVAGLLGGGVGSTRAGAALAGYRGGYFGYFWAVSPVLGGALIVLFLVWVGYALGSWRSWGPEMAAWAAGYPLFIALVTYPTTGLIRYLLLAFPLGMAFVGNSSQSPRRRVVLILVAAAAGMTLQALWVRYALVVPASGAHLLP